MWIHESDLPKFHYLLNVSSRRVVQLQDDGDVFTTVVTGGRAFTTTQTAVADYLMYRTAVDDRTKRRRAEFARRFGGQIVTRVNGG